jgi:GNAT superfamily N-acetyltransferase
VDLVRYADRPDLLERRFDELSARTFPEFLHHNPPGGLYWDRLYEELPEYQLALVEGDTLVAECHAVPTPWDGTVAGLPSGWDEGFTNGMTSAEQAGALMALAISVLPERQGEGLAARMIAAFVDAARGSGLPAVIAPVRPTWKDRYPLVPIERYMAWRRDDCAHFDPWLRVHERVGGRVAAPAPASMTLRAPASDWEEWTGLRLPEDGTYVVPGALAPLFVTDGIGTHVEPNVWVIHDA